MKHINLEKAWSLIGFPETRGMALQCNQSFQLATARVWYSMPMYGVRNSFQSRKSYFSTSAQKNELPHDLQLSSNSENAFIGEIDRMRNNPRAEIPNVYAVFLQRKKSHIVGKENTEIAGEGAKARIRSCRKIIYCH